MPNRVLTVRHPIAQSLLALMLAALVLMSGCASRKPSPDLLLEAEDAIALAIAAGAPEHAPLELDEARRWRDQAADAIAAGDATATAYLVERAALQARLAVVRAEAAIARAELEQRRGEFAILREELRQAFGDRVLENER